MRYCGLKLSRIKFILIGLALTLLGPILYLMYDFFLENYLFEVSGGNFIFLIPAAPPFADWWIEFYIIWPFYLPGLAIVIVGIVLAIKRRNNP